MADTKMKVIMETQVVGKGDIDDLKQSISGLESSAKETTADVTAMEQAIARFKQAISGVSAGNVKAMANATKQLKNEIDSIKGSNAIKQAFKDLDSGDASKIASAVKTLNDEFQRMSMSSQKASSANRSLGDSLKNFRSALGGIDYPFKSLIKSLTRIAKLRVLRGIIRSITGAFKEGLGNIYQYSAALNNTDASHMKGAMDELASSLLYMKNAVASAVAPLIAQLIPVISQVANWFVAAASAVAQFFAVLGGQTTYTRAKKEAATWGQVASGASGAAAAAQEYKNTILGFDEINALNDTPDGGGGGGGGGGGIPDYSNMFEEMAIDPNNPLVKLAKFLKENFDDIWDIVKAIGISLLTWRIAQGVMDFFDKIGFGGAKNAIKAVAGLVISITGISLAYKGGYDIGYEGLTLMNAVKTAIGVALGGIGAGMFTAALGIGSGAGLILGFGIALVGTVIGIQIGKSEKMLDETYRLTDGYREFQETMSVLDEVLSHANTVVDVATEAWSNYNNTISKIKMAEYLIPQIEDLSDKTNKSAFENEKLKAMVEQLNGLGLEGVTAEYDEMTQTVKMDTDEIYKNLNAMKAAAKAEAYIEILKAAWKDEAQAQIDAQIASDAYTDATARREEATRKLLDYERTYTGTLEYSEDVHKQLEQAVYDWRDAENAAYKALGDSNSRLAEAKGYANDAERAYRNLNPEITNTANKYSDLSRSAYGASSGIGDVNNAIGTTSRLYFDTSKITGGFSAIVDWCKRTNTNLRDTSWWIDQLNSKEIKIRGNVVNGGTGGGHYAQYAEGGFVPTFANGGIVPRFDGGGINSANLFLAHENGIPEMVGRIGNRTAVANQGQMVEAMAQGVRMAMSDLMSGSGNTEVNVYMDGHKIARAVDRQNQIKNRRFNVRMA